MRRLGALIVLLLLGACSSAGDPADSFASAGIAAAYIPLSGGKDLFFTGHGAGVVLSRDIAVTNAHNANLVDPDAIVGVSMQYDLMFFHIFGGAPLPTARPFVSEEVIAYGEGSSGGLRVARGRVTALDAPVTARCATCDVQHAFTFEGNAGPGFSGGPVIDATTGKLVGIVFGYNDEANGGRLIYVFDMDRVSREYAILRGRPLAH
ncbi:MAG TPA: trypsin-like peptidase domain-containing protein [Rhizomicrobium sp.]|nr:trypsin-like peptidase domain-containing protein [Rhizomicrobium sp.]